MMGPLSCQCWNTKRGRWNQGRKCKAASRRGRGARQRDHGALDAADAAGQAAPSRRRSPPHLRRERGWRLGRGAGMRRNGEGSRRTHMCTLRALVGDLDRARCWRPRGSWRPADGLRDGLSDGAEGRALGRGGAAHKKVEVASPSTERAPATTIHCAWISARAVRGCAARR